MFNGDEYWIEDRRNIIWMKVGLMENENIIYR